MGKKQKQKVTLPPLLPPEVPEEEIEVSDEDVNFVTKNRAYAGFVSRLDTQSITKYEYLAFLYLIVVGIALLFQFHVLLSPRNIMWVVFFQ